MQAIVVSFGSEQISDNMRAANWAREIRAEQRKRAIQRKQARELKRAIVFNPIRGLSSLEAR